MVRAQNTSININDRSTVYYYYAGPPNGAPLLQPVVTINSTAIRLSWEEVNCTERNGVITGYIVQYSIDGGLQSTINITNITNNTVINGLVKFRSYVISVAAINTIGIGPYSNKKNVYTSQYYNNIQWHNYNNNGIMHAI